MSCERHKQSNDASSRSAVIRSSNMKSESSGFHLRPKCSGLLSAANCPK